MSKPTSPSEGVPGLGSLGWWAGLSPGLKIAFYVAVFAGLIVVFTLLLEDFEKTFPRTCPRCGEVLTKREMGETALVIGGRKPVSQTDLIEWSCGACGWKAQRSRGAPVPYR
ncbi:MAG: hypothetical protein AB1645_02265 [Bacillota bacterium]